jgi:dolichyl-phosphate beta-glucosyltransferase
MKKKLKTYDLTILIPAYREGKRIGTTLDKLSSYIDKDNFFQDKTTEVIIVSADSDDDTHKIITQKQKQFSNFIFLKPGKKVGKGRDVKFGMLKASGNAVLFMDADLATPLKHVKRLYKEYENGADVVIATRNLKKHHSNILRRGVSLAGNSLFRIFGGVWVEDSQCGFKLFSKKAVAICFSKLTIMGWGFDMELLTIAKTNKLNISSVRVNDWRNVPGGTFDGNILNNSLNSLSDLTKILVNRLKRRY